MAMAEKKDFVKQREAMPTLLNVTNLLSSERQKGEAFFALSFHLILKADSGQDVGGLLGGLLPIKKP
jgi:hypothetical protein